MGSFVGRGNQYLQLVKVLYCKLPTNGKQLPAFSLEVRIQTLISEVEGQNVQQQKAVLCYKQKFAFKAVT